MMTKEEMIQDLFNKMWNSLAGQDWMPAHGGDVCFYRMEDGRKCAVGHCIPDDMYSENMEGLPVDKLDITDELGWSRWQSVMNFLDDAQYEHDTPLDGSGGLKARFQHIAEKYGLTIPEPDSSK